jgi:integrase
MALYKRNSTWWTRFTAPNGQRIRRSTRTGDKQQAQEYEDTLKAELWRQRQLKEKPRRLWQDAAVKWLKETEHKRTHQKDIGTLRWLDPHLRDIYLDEIDRELVELIAMRKEADGVKPGTVNRHLAVIKTILRCACFEWDWLFKVPKIRMRKERGRRVRFLSRTEAEVLFRELPPHLSEIARFAVATGLRQSNVCNLKWSQLDLQQQMAWIHEDESKSGYAIGVPLNTEAKSVVSRQLGKHQKFVFIYEGHPVQRVSTHAWYKACQRAGIEDFRFHDLRHTFASWHAQAGTPLSVLQELGGWRSATMVQRYAHLTAGHLVHYANNIVQDTSGTNLAQKPIKGVK